MTRRAYLHTLARDLMDPRTSKGTARWVLMGMAVYDITRHGMNLVNGGALLLLAGVDLAARWFSQGPPPPAVA